jgi:hypothetical protein
MGNFRLLAHPWWVNLTLPCAARCLFAVSPRETAAHRHLLLTSAIFALSFVFVEGAAAIYLGAAGLLPGILARSPMSRDYPPIFSGRGAGTLTICRSAC